MADIELVVKIDEDDYKKVLEINNRECEGEWNIMHRCYEAILNGTPLPKECGNIYAEKNIREQIENPYQCQTVLYGLELVKPIIKGEGK